MTGEKILETVKRIFIEEFEVPENQFSLEANLYEDLGLDSLDSVDLIVCLENEFNFKVDRVKDGPRLKEMRLVKDILDYIDEKKAELTA